MKFNYFLFMKKHKSFLKGFSSTLRKEKKFAPTSSVRWHELKLLFDCEIDYCKRSQLVESKPGEFHQVPEGLDLGRALIKVQ